MKYDNERLSGIYMILNKTNGKFYIGSAVYIKNRLNVHKHNLRSNKHDNSYLQHAFNKDEEYNFEFKQIQIITNKTKLVEYEQMWIDWTKCYERKFGYNLRKLANSNLGIKRNSNYKHSEETKLKISIGNKGKKLSNETREKLKLSVWRKGNAPKKATEKAAIVNRNLEKWPHGYKCKCPDCKITRNNYLYNWRRNTTSNQKIKIIWNVRGAISGISK